MTKEFNASDETSVKNAKQKEKNKLDTELADIKLLLGKQWGRRIVYKILERTGRDRTSFNSDSNVMSFNEGERNIGLWLLDKVVSADRDQYELMQKENLKHGDSNG
jgi:hypothetical protein